MCLVSAQQAGDPYPITESMIVDGIVSPKISYPRRLHCHVLQVYSLILIF